MRLQPFSFSFFRVIVCRGREPSLTSTAHQRIAPMIAVALDNVQHLTSNNLDSVARVTILLNNRWDAAGIFLPGQLFPCRPEVSQRLSL
jgi:hypothetical protein